MESSNILISNIVAEGCEVLVNLQGNTSLITKEKTLGFPHRAEHMSATLRNWTARNCGLGCVTWGSKGNEVKKTVDTTYKGQGVICSDRGCNVDISGFQIANDADYKVNALFLGNFHNVNASDITFIGNCERLFEFVGYNEHQQVKANRKHWRTDTCEFVGIKHRGSCNYVIEACNKDDPTFVKNTFVEVVTDYVDKAIIPPNKLTTLVCDIRNCAERFRPSLPLEASEARGKST